MARVLAAVLRLPAGMLLGLVTGTAVRGALWYGYWVFGVAVLLAVAPLWYLLWRRW